MVVFKRRTVFMQGEKRNFIRKSKQFVNITPYSFRFVREIMCKSFYKIFFPGCNPKRLPSGIIIYFIAAFRRNVLQF